MTINCSRYCNDELFMSILNRLRIIKDTHSRTEDTLESLIKSFSAQRPETEIREIIDALTTENEFGNSGISISIESLMHAGSEFEYGRHNGMYFNNSKSVLGLLMALSNALNITIFVICGRLPLRILHKDEFVLKFNFGETDSSKIVIGLVGLSIFHKLKQPEEDSSTWDALFSDSREITELLLESLSTNPNRDIFIPAAESLETDERDPIETVITPQAPSTDRNVRITTISDFIQSHSSELQGKRMKIDNSAYDCTDRLDFDASSSTEFGTEPITELNFLFDIDGFFGFHEWNENDVFKGDVVISNSPEFDCVKEEANFKRLLSSSQNEQVNHLVFFKIGVSTGIKSIIFDVCFAGIISENDYLMNLNMIHAHIRTAFTYGLDAPCYDLRSQTNLHPDCDSRTYRSVLDAHRNNATQRKISFSNSRYKCFCFHFFDKLQELLGNERIVFDGCYQYLQSVGTKNKLFSNTVNGIFNQIMIINSTIEVDKSIAFYDVAYSILARTHNSATKVNKIVKNIYN